MAGPFSGYGIEPDLKIENIPTSADPYYKELKEVLSSGNILETYSFDDTAKLNKDCSIPTSSIFIRNDNNDYYKNLFYNRGIVKNKKGELKSDLQLHDLIKLRTHSDDLRGDGQKDRLVKHAVGSDAGMFFKSSGTTVGTTGPVDVFRSNLTLSLSRLTNGNLIDWSIGKKIDHGECLFHMAPEMTDFLAFAAIGSDFLRHRGLDVSFGAKVNSLARGYHHLAKDRTRHRRNAEVLQQPVRHEIFHRQWRRPVQNVHGAGWLKKVWHEAHAECPTGLPW